MSDIKISVDTTIAPGANKEITVIRVDGVIDTMTATELEKVANSLLSQKKYNIIVDLGGVDYISSAGWGIFISNIREIRLNNGDIKLARMIPNVYEIFELLEFDSILKAFDNLEKAKADFSGSLASDSAHSEVIEPKPVTVGNKDSGREIARSESKNKPQIRVGENAGLAQDRSSEITSFRETDSVDLSTQEVKRSSSLAEHRTLEDSIMDVIGKDPFLSVGEIRKAVAKEFPKTGYFKTWWTLRKLGLSSKKKRFYFARTRRFTK